MSQPHPELLILAVTLIALGLAPVASHLVKKIGGQISSELDGGRSGEELNTHLDKEYELAGGDNEVAQMARARAFRHGEEDAADRPMDLEYERRRAIEWQRERERMRNTRKKQDPALREEIRSIVIANNERRERAGKLPLDVETETDRRMAALGE